MTQMNRSITPEQIKMREAEIKLGLPSMIPDLV